MTSPRETDAKLSLAATGALIAIVVFPFVDSIGWWTGSFDRGARESRSLVAHAWWWLDEASFGPWYGPALAVGIPVAVALLAAALPAERLTKARVAVVAAGLAWTMSVVALLGIGEDIVFSWIRMPGPLAIQAALVTVFAGVAVARWWRDRSGEDGSGEGASGETPPPRRSESEEEE